METVLIIVALYLIYQSGALAKLFPTLAPPGYVVPPPAQVLPVSSTVGITQQVTAQQVTASVQGGVQAATLAANNLAGIGSAAATTVPIVGAAVAAIAAILLAASKKRAQQATSENSAVAQGVPGWDSAIAQIVAAFNTGSIDSEQAITLLSSALQNYWNEVTPQIQPGRNGCNGGASCPAVTGTVSSQNTNEGGNSYCTGNIGAACCVGCTDLNLSTSNMIYAVNRAGSTGIPVSGTWSSNCAVSAL